MNTVCLHGDGHSESATAPPLGALVLFPQHTVDDLNLPILLLILNLCVVENLRLGN